MAGLFERWEPCVQREVEKSCALCGKDFSFVRREHQCKRCLRAVCSDCSGDKLPVYKQGFQRRPHRGCRSCQEEQREVLELLEANRLQFGRLSPLGSKWLARIEKRPLAPSLDARKHKKFTREVFGRMWDAYNYSLREFVGLLTFEFDQEEVFRTVADVVTTVVSILPEEDLESVALLAVFLLCFCSPDKAPFLCLYLLELKAAVANQQGLLQAYLRAAGVGEVAQEKLGEFQRRCMRRFLGAFSVNSVSARTSMEVVQRVLTKRRMEEVYVQLALSLDLLRDSVLARKDNLPYCELLMVRTCTIDATAAKYKLPAILALKTTAFMRERTEQQQQQQEPSLTENSFVRNQREEREVGAMAASFSEGIRGKESIGGKEGKEGRMPLAPNNPEPFPSAEVHPSLFRKRTDIKEDSFIEDSFSVISMIDEMNQPSNRQQDRASVDILHLMSAEQRSNDSLELKQASGEKPIGFPELNLSLEVADFPCVQSACEKCPAANRALAALTREVEELKLQRAKQEEEYKRQVKLLQEEIRNSTANMAKPKGNSNEAVDKIEYESQIRKLKISLGESEQRERELQASLARADEARRQGEEWRRQGEEWRRQAEEARRQALRLEAELKAANLQLNESATTVKLMRNRMETAPGRQPVESSEAARVNEVLKQSLRDKNQEIEQLSKKNKLMQYQLEEVAKDRLQDREKAELRSKLARAEREREEVIVKMKELSGVLMEMEEEKLGLSEEVFELKDALRGKGVQFTRS